MFTVLMSLYYRENPEYLRLSLESVFNQTLPPHEVILVKDGPLTPELDEVVDEYSTRHSELKVIPLAHNLGLGRALNIGLTHCSHELVIRMDTDDICLPSRFEIQTKFMEENPDIDISGTWLTEFIDNPQNTKGVKNTPLTHSQIVKSIRTRSPFNHPTVIFRKSKVMEAGNYQHFHLLEDWWLWGRMIKAGARTANIPESLLLFRTTNDSYMRRGGWKYAKNIIILQSEFYKLGITTWHDFLKCALIRIVVSSLPNSLRRFLYNNALRKKQV